ncbi:MAG: Kelch repeat-containing protein, partial [Candidatus Thorarchaeota archaeon]
MKRYQTLSYLIVTCFLLIPLFSVIPQYGSSNFDSAVANIDLQRDFTPSSTYLEPGGRADAMVAYDSESDVAIIYGGWDDPDPWELDDTWAYSYNTNTWENMSPTIFPSRREVGSMAYDSQSDLMVLFGGYTDFASGTTTNQTWTYSYNTNTWTQMSPSAAPIGRVGSGMVYDSESDRIIMFGGTSLTTGYYDDTWAYDIESDTWTQMSPTVSPEPRYFPAMAYDEESDRVILFGGRPEDYFSQRNIGDTWAYDFNTDTWDELIPKNSTAIRPDDRRAHSMVYDSLADKMVMFGGSNDDDNALRDTWLYDYNSNNWTQASPANRPSTRLRHRMVYDSESDVVLSFFGSRPTYSGGAMIPHDLVWAYDTDNDHWRRMSPITQSGLVDVMMAHDTESDMTIIFGGEDPAITGQTWAYDLDTDTYFNMAPFEAPSPRAAGGIAYDSQSDRIIQFGGILSTSTQEASNETWIYDYNSNNWTLLAPAIAPSPRLASYLTYDSGSDRVILFGGVTLQPSAVIHSDTWAFDLETTTWEEMNSSGPAARYGAAITYDVESDRVIVFGGNPSASTTTNTFSDTLIFDYDLNRWAEVTPTGNPPAGYTGRLVYDVESDKAVFFGGYPDADQRNATWTFDLNANLWSQSTPNPSPYGRFRHNMVYDAGSDSVILFGGKTGDWFSGEIVPTDTTWSYDVNTDTWTQMSALPGPTPTTTTTSSPTTPVEPGGGFDIVVIAAIAI